MFFSFDYNPLVAIIGDIKNSKQLENRRAVQIRLKEVLDAINHEYRDNIASKFMITLGDEFQGLLKAGSSAIFIIDKIEREMHPIQLRFGIGVGEITTDINSNMPLGADGPAYYNARKMIDGLKASEKKKMESKVNVRIEVQGNPDMSELINTVFSLLTTIKETWTPRQVEIINSYLKTGGTQKDTARILNINQSNVQKALSSANYYTYRKAIETIAKVLSDIKEDNGV
ncbi:SatD family protein [Caproiciproducens sp. CPB-2]|uniref:SatD family protein n=1 Tax=unclassified Caproiciproducens TaxID=2643836 RepID=UPI0023DBC625|nr:SatD family protein [Caproiciproducens sp. CPB-2]MDF1496073.1 SatD family protein [Caproiciproducens sp. CPB-2]